MEAARDPNDCNSGGGNTLGDDGDSGDDGDDGNGGDDGVSVDVNFELTGRFDLGMSSGGALLLAAAAAAAGVVAPLPAPRTPYVALGALWAAARGNGGI